MGGFPRVRHAIAVLVGWRRRAAAEGQMELWEQRVLAAQPKLREVLDCASPLALSDAAHESEKRQRTAAVQDAAASDGAPGHAPALGVRQPSGAFDVKLTKFLPSLAEVPSKELAALKERAVKSGFDFIDFWAVDFDWHPGQPFNHHWQDYRTRKDRSLKTVSDAGHVYEQPGSHSICVKVVDVFGCDSSIVLEVEV